MINNYARTEAEDMIKKKESEFYINARGALFINDMDEFAKNVDLIIDTNEVNREKQSLAFTSIAKENLFALKLLADRGADLNIKDRGGWSLLHLAASFRNFEICSFLIEHGADVNAKDGFGCNVIFRAAFSSRGEGEIIKLLLAAGADPTIKNNHGVSAIDVANRIANYNVKQFFDDF